MRRDLDAVRGAVYPARQDVSPPIFALEPPYPPTRSLSLQPATGRILSVNRDRIVSGDDARLLPRFRDGGTLLERHRMGRAQAAALADGLAGNPSAAAGKRSAQASPGDLRGIPVIGRGVGGTSPGTSPESAIERVHRERERQARAALNEPMVAFG